MPLQWISLIILVLFIGQVMLRTLSLRSRGIRAFVFGKTDRGDYLLLPFMLLFLYAILASAFSLPLPGFLSRFFYRSELVRWIGLLVSAFALFLLSLTLRSFGDSFRVGIDEKNPDRLVTDGAFAHSRNPVYVCFFLMCVGLFMTYPNAAMACMAVLFMLAIHRQVLREERFLRAHYGDAYAEYARKVRRYV